LVVGRKEAAYAHVDGWIETHETTEWVGVWEREK